MGNGAELVTAERVALVIGVRFQYRSVKPFALSLSKGWAACQQGFDKLSPNGWGA